MSQPYDHEQYPHLSRLRLSEDDLAAVSRQGFVSGEQRRASLIYKLRFRCATTGRQHVRYIGTDRTAADAVSDELAMLQRGARQHKCLRRLEVDARRLLRETKERVQHLLKEGGYHFYGLEIRAHRRRVSDEYAPNE
jgi:hypothetical protein